MDLKIRKADAELKNVNLRTENNGDERVLAVDLKLVAFISAKEAAPLFEDAPAQLDSMFDKGGNVLNPLFELKYRVPIENVDLVIDDLKTFKGGRVKKGMTMVPRNGKRFEIKLTVQLSDVPDIRPLAKRLNEEVRLTIVERQQKLKLESVPTAATG